MLPTAGRTATRRRSDTARTEQDRLEARLREADRRQRDDARDLVRIGKPIGERDRASERMTDDDGPLDSERTHRLMNEFGLPPEAGIGAAASHALATSGTVKSDHTERGRERRYKPDLRILKCYQRTMDHDERRAVPGFRIRDRPAVF